MKKTVHDLKTWFDDAEDATDEARTLAERDRDYYDNKQWTEEEAIALNKRGQQAIVINRIRKKVNYLLGYEQKLRTDPKAFPRTPEHTEAADAATDALRFVSDKAKLNNTKSAVFSNMIVEGYGGAEVTIKEAKDGVDIIIRHVHWDRLFYDPNSRERDFSDARYLGTVQWLDRDKLKAMFPNKKEAIDAMNTDVGLSSETYEDKPTYGWYSNSKDRVKIISMYYTDEEGVWFHCLFGEHDFLKDPLPVPFVNAEGKNYCNLIMQSAFCTRENERYGIVREMVDIQDEINKRRSKALHLLTMRQTVGEIGAVGDINAMKREMAKPNGHVEVASGMRFEVLNTQDQMRGQLELLQEAKSEIDILGANAALTGTDNLGLSGKAIQAQQQGGNVELQPLMDCLRHWHLRVIETCWALVKQYWTAEKWVRVTDDENNLKWVGLNKQITVGEQIQQRFAQLPPEEQQARQQELMMAMQDPRAQQVVVENNVAEMDVDIIIDEQPDTVTLQAEQFEGLTKMVQAGVPIPPDVLIEASSLRNKKVLLEKLQKMNEADPMTAEQKKLQLREQAAKAVKDETQAELNSARAGKEQVQTQVAYNTPLPAPQQMQQAPQGF